MHTYKEWARIKFSWVIFFTTLTFHSWKIIIFIYFSYVYRTDVHLHRNRVNDIFCVWNALFQWKRKFLRKRKCTYGSRDTTETRYFHWKEWTLKGKLCDSYDFHCYSGLVVNIDFYYKYEKGRRFVQFYVHS